MIKGMYYNELGGYAANTYYGTCAEIKGILNEVNVGDGITIRGEFCDEMPLIVDEITYKSMEACLAGKDKAEVVGTADGRMAIRFAWCECGGENDPEKWVEYRDFVTGRHGFICADCRKLTQVG